MTPSENWSTKFFLAKKQNLKKNEEGLFFKNLICFLKVLELFENQF